MDPECRPSSEPAATDFSSTPTRVAPREPPHVHVERDVREAKFWLRPEVAVAYNDGFNARTLRELLALVEAKRERIERAWNEFFR
ncbi:MAG: DUF4160 domain-containing protein [Stellaceae bacterium]